MIAFLRRHRSVVKIAGVVSIGFWGVAALTSVATPTLAGATTAKAPHHAAKVGGDFARTAGPVPARGELDCNGYSPAQRPIRPSQCTDIRGFAGVSNQNTWDARFFDNGHYIGHDEPDTTFISNQPGSGNDVTWNVTLGRDPAALPTGTNPGHDVSNWFELTPAPWLSMAMCDPNSYPQLPCVPESDTNAPSCPEALHCPSNAYPGGGSAFMEMQFYPPGNAPFIDSESCNGTQWCAAVTVDSLECTLNYVSCNTDCEEPQNFAFVEIGGVPDTNLFGFEPDKNTLLMNPGDKVSVHMYDAPVPGEPGQKAFQVVIRDLTTGHTGIMQASGKNGFVTTSMSDCSQTPFNFQPEYSTASVGNYIPWAALQTNVSTEFETGHWESCTSLGDEFPNSADPDGPNPFDADDTGGTYNECFGPYETAGGDEGPETGDGLCYYAGDTHSGFDGVKGDTTPPDRATGCQDNFEQNGDLDFDGEPYYRGEWPTSAAPPTASSRLPSSFVDALPTTNGSQYPRFFFQTDVGLSEFYDGCGTVGAGCTVPPKGPGDFYPYWSEVDSSGTCSLEFGNVSSGAGVNNFGEDAEYGSVQFATLGYPEIEGKIFDNSCPPKTSAGYLLVSKSGAVVSAGDAGSSVPGVHAPNGSLAGIAGTPDGRGYFAVTDTGAVYTAGDAGFYGDLTTLSTPVKANVVGIAPTADGRGYWLVSSDGGVYAFGDAKYRGSLPGIGMHLSDIVAVVASGGGYVAVSADGGVYAFGGARYYGSLTGDHKSVNDIKSVVISPAGGYVLIGGDGGAFAFGPGAHYAGSAPGEGVLTSEVVGAALSPDGDGYWMALSNGSILYFGDAKYLPGAYHSSDGPIVGIAGMNVDNPD